MKSIFTGITDPGLVRTVNQDAYHIDSNGRFFIVADGMGGHAGGQEASAIATKEITNYLEENWTSDESSSDLLKKAFLKANQAILEDQLQHPERSDMGTTAVVVIFRQDQPYVAHVGDSRFYRFRNDQLEQITQDHTWVARAMLLGDLTPEEARHHPWRHVLSQCLGRRDIHQIDIDPIDIVPGDRLILCSDGLTEELNDLDIHKYLHENLELPEIANDLVTAAKKHGGKDNITIVLVEVHE